MSPSPRVAFMVTCLGDLFYPEVGERIVRLLQRLGVHLASDLIPDEKPARTGSPKTGWAITRTFERRRTRIR